MTVVFYKILLKGKQFSNLKKPKGKSNPQENLTILILYLPIALYPQFQLPVVLEDSSLSFQSVTP